MRHILTYVWAGFLDICLVLFSVYSECLTYIRTYIICMYIYIGTVTSSTGLKRKAEPVVGKKGKGAPAGKKGAFGKR